MAKAIVYNVKTGETEIVEIDNYAVDVENDWRYNYPVRIVAPKTLALLYTEIYIWFKVNDLPVEIVEEYVHLYCNEIMQEHKSIVDQHSNIITVEYKP